MSYLFNLHDRAFMDRLNSATKYPSIPTFHVMDGKGFLSKDVQPSINLDEDMVVTEKVDGANTRIIVLPDDSVVFGSRERLLHVRGDHIAPDEIELSTWLYTCARDVDAIVNGAVRLRAKRDSVVVVYAEAAGGKIGKAARAYTHEKERHILRVFDARVVDMERVPMDLADIARRRDDTAHEGMTTLETLAHIFKDRVVPHHGTVVARTLVDHDAALRFAAGEVACGASGAKREGVVLRTWNRRYKVRVQDLQSAAIRRAIKP